MGVVESKKDGVVRKFQLKINLQSVLKNELLGLSNCTQSNSKGLLQTLSKPTTFTAA